MKKSAKLKYVTKLLPVFLLILIGANEYSFTTSGSDPDQVVIAFVTYNDHGNNLYLDNLTTGARPNVVDLSITSFVNIPNGTFITPGSVPLIINPEIHLTNIGAQSFVPDTGEYVYFRSFSNSYIDSIPLPSLNAGQDTSLIF